jgi:hypothetical protein
MDVEKMINLLMFSLAQAVIITFLMYLFCINPKVVAWERRVWASFKRWLRRQLRKSERIVAWAESEDKPYDVALAKEPWSNWSEWAV